MPTFKVVLDGMDLSPDQTVKISKAIQRAVLLELADRDETVDNAGRRAALPFALQPFFQGQTMGLVATEPASEERLGAIVATEFGG
jgi:hypothetical protein